MQQESLSVTGEACRHDSRSARHSRSSPLVAQRNGAVESVLAAAAELTLGDGGGQTFAKPSNAAIFSSTTAASSLRLSSDSSSCEGLDEVDEHFSLAATSSAIIMTLRDKGLFAINVSTFGGEGNADGSDIDRLPLSPAKVAKEVPPGIGQVVVVSFMGQDEIPTADFISAFCADHQKEVPPPVIVLLVADDVISFDEVSFLTTQRLFLQAGAEEVVLQRGLSTDRSLDIRMAIERITMDRKARDKVLKRRAREAFSHAFWSEVHNMILGFPKCQWDQNVKPAVGTMVGSRRLVKWLGKGRFGSTLMSLDSARGQHEALKFVAKTYPPSLHQACRIWKEMLLLSRVQHSSVVQLHCVFHTRNHVIFCMEYVGSENLYRFLATCQSRSHPLNCDLLWQTVTGLQRCHQALVAHCDIKPENLVVSNLSSTEGVLKIVDFGSAERTTKPCRHVVGTVPFIPPEVMLCDAWDTKAHDMWAIGVVTLELFCGIGQVNRLLRWSGARIQPCRSVGVELEHLVPVLKMSHDLGLPDDVMDMLCALLDPDPAVRWTAEDAEAAPMFVDVRRR